MSPLLLDHLWQSSVVLAVIGLLTLFFRNNGAHVRHALWTMASLKFLLPFALLTALGGYVTDLLATPVPAPPVLEGLGGAAQPFSHHGVIALAAAPVNWLPLLTALWAAGFLMVCGVWLARWMKLRAVLRAARDTNIAAPMTVKMSATLLEPGLVGVFRPILLLPEGIAEKLVSAELQSIIAHEVCHMRRRDNLTAVLHMTVEALFWFWPPVWWLGARLVAEREKACDEAVLASGGDPQVYAESILKVCKFYVSSPLTCAAGVSGADLKQRMEDIMKNNVIVALNIPRKALLAASVAAALALPLAAGVFTALPVFAQAANSAVPSPGTEAALRRQIAGWEKRQPVLEDMTPNWANATRQEQATDQKLIDAWGPLKSITFKGSMNGDDFYQVEFQHGLSLWEVSPLQHGKIQWLTIQQTVARTNGPSPGVEAALRSNYAALLKGALDYNLLSPAMAKAKREQGFWVQDAKNLGALKSISFNKVTPRGLDLYAAVFANGTATWEAAPLAKGKLNNLNWSHVLLPRAPRHPGTDIALRDHIESLQKDQPNYDDMTPEFAALQRQSYKGFEDEIRPWGAIRTITFKGVGSRGWDLYDVTFDHARVEWHVAPLSADGKTANLACGEVKLLGPQAPQE